MLQTTFSSCLKRSKLSPVPACGLVGSLPLLLPRSFSNVAEVNCKLSLRPTWSLPRWHEKELHRLRWPDPLPDALDCPQRLHHSGKAMDRFVFDPSLPAVLEGVLETWPVQESWRLDSLLRDYGTYEFVVGATLLHADNVDDPQSFEEVPVKMTLQDYWDYSLRQRDDSPLYIFDDLFLDSIASSELAYHRPRCIKEDLMDLLRPKVKVPYRGFLAGAERSGTSPHVDTLHTSAWNTLLNGLKRWVLLPPSTPACEILHAGFSLHDAEAGHSDEDVYPCPAGWLHERYPNLGELGAACIDFLQRPGETVYVPRGWWHSVMNVQFSVAITENFFSRRDFTAAYEYFCCTEPELANAWLAAISDHPDLKHICAGRLRLDGS